MFLARQELEGEHVLQLTPVELDGRAPIDGIQVDTVLEAGLDEMPFEGLVIAALDLVRQQQGQERHIVQVLSTRQRQAFGQRRHQWPKFEPFEQPYQIGIDAHGWSSTGGAAKRWSKALPGRAKRPTGSS